MEPLIKSFGIEWKLLIAQIVNFGILAFVLFRLVYKPLLKVLDERESMVREAEKKSSSIDSMMSEIKSLEEKVLSEARMTSQKLIKDAEASALSLKNKLSEEAHTHAERIIKEAQAKLASEQSKRDEELKKEIKNIIALAIEATVGKYIDENAKTKLVDEAHRETQKVESFVSKN